MKKQRDLSFDGVKIILMYLVVVGHCVQTFRGSIYYEEPMYQILYTFHMPAFMCVAGYFSINTLRNNDFHAILKKKAVQLLLPCLSWGIIIYLFSMMLCNSSEVNLVNILCEDYWFLKSLFVCYVSFYFALKYSKWGG